jgi:hypothetical protein
MDIPITPAVRDLHEMIEERARCRDRSRLGPMDKAIAEQRAMVVVELAAS